MPFEIMDPKCVSMASDFHDLTFLAERQIGFWKPNITSDHHGLNANNLSPFRAHSMDYSEVEQSYAGGDQKAKSQVGEADQTANFSKMHFGFMEQISSIAPSSMHPSAFRVDGNRVQHESSLFSRSLSETFSQKLRLSPNDVLLNQSAVTEVFEYGKDESIEYLKELEIQTIGNILPDEDDLFSGVTDELEFTAEPIGTGNLDDFDIFCSGGGMELDGNNLSFSVRRSVDNIDDISDGQGSLNGSIISELPSRTLFVRNVDCNIEDHELKLMFERYGDIRTFYTDCKHRRFVMISYHDIRAAVNATRELQTKPLRNRNLDIHYSIPKDSYFPEQGNEGTLVVFNRNYSISNDDIYRIFGVHGDIKEIREVPNKHHQKLVEYYDVRAAEAALWSLNRVNSAKKPMAAEPSLPKSRNCRHTRLQCSSEIVQDTPTNGQSPYSSLECSAAAPLWNGLTKSSFTKSGPSQEKQSAIPVQAFNDYKFSPGYYSAPNTFHSEVQVCATKPYGIDESCYPPNHMSYGFAGTDGRQIAGVEYRHIGQLGPNGHPREASGFGSLRKNNFPLHGHPYGLNNSHPYQNHTSSPLRWQNLPSLTNGVCVGYPEASSLQGYHAKPSGTFNPSMWERRSAYTHEATRFQLGSSLNSLENASHLLFSSGNSGICSPQEMSHVFPGRYPTMSVPSSFESSRERARFCRKDINSNHGGKKQFELDIDSILQGKDCRTTLMLKNIPNKYTSKMLLASIDEQHQGTYDFIYLPIDFKNKCNVGYAFINMIDPLQIVPFYKNFNGMKWEKFNSEKVASLAYARIQGKVALVTHFQNSSLMNEDKRCRPIIFHTDGPNAGDQEPFPVGSNIRSRYGKSRVFVSDEKNRGSPSTSANGEESSNETDSSSGSTKDY